MKIFRLFKKYPPRFPPTPPLPPLRGRFSANSGTKSTSPTFCSLLAQTVDRRVCLCKWQTRLVIFLSKTVSGLAISLILALSFMTLFVPLLSKAWSASKHNVHDRKDKNFSFTLLKLITSEIFSIKKKETKQNGTGIHVKSTLFKTQDTFRTGTKCPGGTPSYKPYRYRPPQG